MGCLYIVTVLWGLFISMAINASWGKESGGFTLSLLLVGWGPASLLVWQSVRVAKKRELRLNEVVGQSGIQADSKFFHHEGDTMLALNEALQTLTVADGTAIKTYQLADVRGWEVRSERAGQVVPMGGGLAGGVAAGAASVGMAAQAAANTGLFLSVKDIEHPTWRIAMMAQQTRDVWFEILTQAINEGGTGHA